MKFDETSLKLVAKLLNQPLDRIKLALESEFKSKEVNTIISIKEILDQTGMSYSTLKRRLKEHEIELVTMPGWKVKKGVLRQELNDKLSLFVTRGRVT